MTKSLDFEKSITKIHLKIEQGMREQTCFHSLINIKEVTVKLLEVEVQLGVEENENENENGAASPWGKLQFSE